ncbi:MAG: methylamine utilization protein [Pseudomonadota bacterium]
MLDQQGQPLPNAVVTLRDGVTAPPLPDSEPAIMRQRGQQFEPRLLLVPVGTLVSFPNEDATAHHVYSFSPTKPFELDLYKGDLHPPLRFDKAGVVVLGCNIHDAMRGVIYVTDAPSYARSDAQGMVTLPALPGEQQELTLWHPRQISAVPPVAWATGTPPPALIVAVNAPAAPVVRGLANWRKARAQAR